MAARRTVNMLRAGTLSRYGERLFLVGLALLGLWQTARFYGGTYDDVFLAYRYARNLLAGHGFVYNPGENFLGTPAPLFVFLLVLAKRILRFLDIVQIGGLISGTALTLCALFIYLLARRFGQRLVGVVAAFFVLFNPLILMTLGGETPIYLMLISASFYSYSSDRHPIAGLLLALALLTRGEALIPTVVILCHSVLTTRRIPWRAMAVFFAILAPWLLFCFAVFGSPLTQSLAAKMAQRRAGFGPFMPGAIFWVKDVVFHGKRLTMAFVPLIVLGALGCLLRARSWLPFFAWIAAQTAGYLVLDLPFFHWYIAHIGLGVAVLCGLAAAAPLWLRSSDVKKARPVAVLDSSSRVRVVRGAGMALVSLCLILSATVVIEAVETHGGGQQASPPNLIYMRTGKWLAQHTTPTASVAYVEIGQIGYYSNRKIVDVLGLVTPGVAKRVAKGDFLWVYLAYQPDYVIYNDLWEPWIGVVREQDWFQEAYYEVEQIEQPGYPVPLIIYQRDLKVALPLPMEQEITQAKYAEPAGEIYEGHVVGQTFMSHRSHLNGIAVLLATYARENTQPVAFHLLASSSSDAHLARIEFSALEVADNQWRVFRFDPLPDSQERSYYFYFESPKSAPGDAITAWISPQDVYQEGTLARDHKLAEGDIAFKTYYLSGPKRALSTQRALVRGAALRQDSSSRGLVAGLLEMLDRLRAGLPRVAPIAENAEKLEGP